MRWFWYVLIAVCLVIALVMWASSSPVRFDNRYDGWAQLAILTAGVFGYLLKWGWHYRKRARFWQLCAVLFLGHCAVFVTVLSHGRWHVLILAVVGSLEVMALAALISWIMGEKF
jgi:hypothetical protein